MSNELQYKYLDGKVEYDNIIYLINTEENTAAFFGIEGNHQKIIIPRSIYYESNEYYVTSILKNAFKNSNIDLVLFEPHSKLQTIDKNAFFHSSIKSIQIPPSVTSIGENAFSDCKQLEMIEIPEDSKLQTIDKDAFSWSSITSIRIPSSVTSIGENAFSNCELEVIEIPEDSKLQTIDKDAFSWSLIESIRIPLELIDLKDEWCSYTSFLTEISVSPENPRYFCYENKMIIGKSRIEQSNYDCLVFGVRNIQQIKIPNFIEHICSFSFECCDKLEVIEIQDDSKLKTIDKYAFSFAKIKSIRIPASVTSIGKYAFLNCIKLEVIGIQDDSKLKTIDNDAFSGSKIKSIKIPSSIKSIGEKAFYNCRLCIIEVVNAKMISLCQTAFKDCQNALLMIPINS